MRPHYIEITAGHPDAIGLHRDPDEAARLLAELHYYPSDRDAIEAGIKRAAAELATALPSATIDTDLWTANVFDARHYDDTHGRAR